MASTTCQPLNAADARVPEENAAMVSALVRVHVESIPTVARF